MPLPELVDALNHEFAYLHPPRTLTAVRCRATDSNLSVEYLDGYTMMQLAHIVGWNGHTETRRGANGAYGPLIWRHWIEPGLLEAKKIWGLGAGGRWQIKELDFARFLEEHPYAYDWRRFAPGPWRGRAEVIARRSPWRTVDELRQYLKLEHFNFWQNNWKEIPHKRRHHVLGGMNHVNGQPMIDLSLFPEIRDMIAPTIWRYARVGGHTRGWSRTCRCGVQITGQPGDPTPQRCASCGESLRRGGEPPLIDRRARPPRREISA
jgi:hypothetical protein